MNKVYLVKAYGGCYEESYVAILKVFASKDKAGKYVDEFLNSPERHECYEDLYDVCVEEWDVD